MTKRRQAGFDLHLQVYLCTWRPGSQTPYIWRQCWVTDHPTGPTQRSKSLRRAVLFWGSDWPRETKNIEQLKSTQRERAAHEGTTAHQRFI